MNTTSSTLLQYSYDALDRLVSRSIAGQSGTAHFFYYRNRLTSEVEEQVHTTLLHASDQLLAQQCGGASGLSTRLLATDHSGSLTNGLSAVQNRTFTYMPYGSRHPLWVTGGSLGFKGERLEPVTALYLSGNGYRAFNPVLMRFHNPDSFSPFAAGGLNSYAYCGGDPLNRSDPTGHIFKVLMVGLSDFLPSRSKQRFKVVAPGIIGFDKPHGSRKTFNIVSHGSSDPLGGYHPLVTNNDELVSAITLRDRLLDVGVDLSRYERIRMMSCYSADGTNPFAAQLSKLTRKPVKGYKGLVSVTGMFYIENGRYVRQISQHEYEYSGQIRAIKIRLPGALNERLPFTYKPVIFNP